MQRSSLASVFVLLFGGVMLPQLAFDKGPDLFEVVHEWPVLPDGFALGQTTGVGVDSSDKVFVCHRGPRPVLCFEGTTGKLLGSWGDGMFAKPHGLEVDFEDNVWVTDTGHHQVFKFSNTGALLMTLGTKDVPGQDGSHFFGPTDVVVAANGEFYVSDGYGNSRITKFSPKGDLLTEWGMKGSRPGEFDTPHGMAIDEQGRVYVADRGNARIQVFDRDGRFLHLWRNDDLGRPWGLEVSPDGFLFVVDGGDLTKTLSERNRALKLDLNGKHLVKWGAFGSYDGQFFRAHDIAVSRLGDVYIADVHFGMRVQKFRRKRR